MKGESLMRDIKKDRLQSDYFSLCLVFGSDAHEVLATDFDDDITTFMMKNTDEDMIAIVALSLRVRFCNAASNLVDDMVYGDLPFIFQTPVGDTLLSFQNSVMSVKADALVRFMLRDRTLNNVAKIIPADRRSLEMIGMAANNGHMDFARCIATAYAHNTFDGGMG